jgi:hyperosmotically inducible protein
MQHRVSLPHRRKPHVLRVERPGRQIRKNGNGGIVKTSGSSRITGVLAALAITLGATAAQAQTPNDMPNGATATGQPITTSSIHRRTDNDIARDVRRALTRAGVNVSGIHVRSRNAAVTLTGHVPQRAQVTRAGSAARSVRGVRSVSNRVTVRTRGGNVH